MPSSQPPISDRSTTSAKTGHIGIPPRGRYAVLLVPLGRGLGPLDTDGWFYHAQVSRGFMVFSASPPISTPTGRPLVNGSTISMASEERSNYYVFADEAGGWFTVEEKVRSTPLR